MIRDIQEFPPSTQSYINEVLKNIPILPEAKSELNMVRIFCALTQSRRFSVADAAEYISYTAEISPDIDESTALELMSRISAKYIKPDEKST